MEMSELWFCERRDIILEVGCDPEGPVVQYFVCHVFRRCSRHGFLRFFISFLYKWGVPWRLLRTTFWSLLAYICRGRLFLAIWGEPLERAGGRGRAGQVYRILRFWRGFHHAWLPLWDAANILRLCPCRQPPVNRQLCNRRSCKQATVDRMSAAKKHSP